MSRYYDEDSNRYVDGLLQPQTDLERSRDYLRDRVSQIYNDRIAKLYVQFGLEDDAQPMSAAELVKRIQDGKFVLEDKTKDWNETPRYSVGYISWRDPSIKKDTDGFNAASDAFRKAKTSALDVVNTSTPEAGLSAIQTLEAWTA